MPLSQFILIMQARWRLVASIVMLVLTLVAVVTMLLPKQYTASASALVDVKTGSIDPIAGVVLPGNNASSFIATQADVIISERVVKQALRSIRAFESSAIQDEWRAVTGGEGDFESWLASTVGKKLEVHPSRESNVINITYTSPDRQFATAMTNAVVQAYIDVTLDMRVEPAKRYSSFFDNRAKQLRAALEAAQSNLSAYQQAKGITSTEDHLDIETTKLAELSSQLVMLQAIATESDSRQVAANAKGDRMSEVLSNGLVTALAADLARQEAKLQELSQRYGDNHPQVQEVKANQNQLKIRYEAEVRKVTASVGINGNVNSSRLAQLKSALQEQRTRVLQLKSERDQAAVLLRDVENAQRAYDSMLARASQASLESQNSQTNISLLKQASLPPFPSSPNLTLNLILGVILGICIGVGIAMALELANPKLRSETDIQSRLKQHMLGVLPTTKSSHAMVVEAVKSKLLSLSVSKSA